MQTSAPARIGLAATTILVAIIIMSALLLHGAAAADTHLPRESSNPMADVITGQGQEPQVRISWDAPSEGTVDRHTVSRNDGQNFEVPGGATTHSDRGIVPGTAYSYTITAHNGAGASPASDPATASVPAAPTAPGGMTATAADPKLADTSASVTMTWNPATAPQAGACEQAFPVAGYVVERVHGDGSTVLADLDPDAGSFTDDGTDFGAEYTYRVYATSDIGNSPAATVTLTTPLRPAGTPTGLTAGIADPFDGNVSLSWNAPSEGPAIAGYLVVRYLGADPYQGTDIPDTLDEMVTETTLADATAEAGVTYSYIVMARSADNVSPPSNTAVIEPPAAPTGLTASPGDGAIDLAWTAAAAGTTTGYRMERMEQGGERESVADTTANSHSDTTALPNTVYVYRVQNRNAHGGSAWTLSETVNLVGIPGRPTGVEATVSGDDIVLSWTAPTGNTVGGYHVSYGVQGEQTRETASAASGVTSFIHSDNTEGTTYEYRVRAHNAGGNGPWSEPVTATRLNPPQPPTSVTSAASGVDIIVRWTAPESGITGSYDVRYGKTGSVNTTTVNVVAEHTSFTHENPQGDTSFTYHVRSVNDAGHSEWAGPTRTTRVMLPNAPTGLDTAISGDDIVVSWTAPTTGIIDHYQIEHRGTNTHEWTRNNVPSDAASWTHAAPTPGTQYKYRARSVNSAGVSDWTTTVRRTWYQGAAPPTSFRISLASNTYVILQWVRSTDSGVTSYDLSTSVNGGTPTITGNGNRSFRVDYYDAGNTHREYAVRAVSDGTPGDWTSTVRASLTQPGHVTDLIANLEGRDGVRLHWQEPATGQPYQYVVESKRSTDADYPANGAGTSHRYSRTTALPDLDPGATYNIRVRAQSHSGLTSPETGAAEATITIPDDETVRTDYPSGLRIVMVDRTTFTLAWTQPESRRDQITGYRIFRKDVTHPGRLTEYANVLISNTGTTDTVHRDHTGTPGVTYQYGIAVHWPTGPQAVTTTAYARPW